MKLLKLLAIPLIIVIMISCKDLLTDPDPSFQGVWEFNYANGYSAPHRYYIDSKNKFSWKDSLFAIDYTSLPFTHNKVTYTIVGAVTPKGELMADVFFTGSQTKNGTFKGNLTKKDGHGFFNYTIFQSQNESTWYAVKK
jgi:hypothetical protein